MAAKAVLQEVRHIHDLVTLRNLLAESGVTNEELRRYDATIVVARDRLASLAPDTLKLAA